MCGLVVGDWVVVVVFQVWWQYVYWIEYWVGFDFVGIYQVYYFVVLCVGQIGQQYGVYLVYVVCVIGYDWMFDDIGMCCQGLFILVSYFLVCCQGIVDMFYLCQVDGGGDVGYVVVEVYYWELVVMFWVYVLVMVQVQVCGQFVVIGGDYVVFIGGDDFVVEEVEGCVVVDVVYVFVVVFGIVCFGSVFDYFEVVFVCQFYYWFYVGWVIVQVYYDDGFGVWGDFGFQLGWIYVYCVGFGIYQYWFGIVVCYCIGGSDVGQGWDQDFIVFVDIQCDQCQMDGSGVVVDGYCVVYVIEVGEVLFEFVDEFIG